MVAEHVRGVEPKADFVLAGGTDFLRTNEVIAAAPGVFNALREALGAARTP